MSYYKTKADTKHMALFLDFHVDRTMCDNPDHYDEFIRYQALSDQKSGLGTTYLYIEQEDVTGKECIMGYITLRTSAFIKDMGEAKKFGYPALEIAELAVDKRYVGQYIGTDMVIDSINIANELNENISVKYIVLCADPRAEQFYEKLEFVRMQSVYEEVPREHANIDCVPMYLKLR